ncbi:hypothetical protein B0H94_1113 [Salsuginibacillus halophilus]|uniref:PAP2 superfamily protein n=1 Tax=Salsuginibacillus halophilus TaxID=517424 RepID=A0A2P8HAG0_9BACI|nr:hypothetical protein [Salsuginibacillus halophilus]PSL43181.1 hypothetical protein B0H94_1113 [Salsuginibacillus halophilus]
MTSAADALSLVVPFSEPAWYYLIIIPLIYWLVDKSAGFRLFVLFLLSMYLNVFARTMPQLQEGSVPLFNLEGPLIPDPHVQAGATVLGFFILEFSQRKITWAAFGGIIFISIVVYMNGTHLFEIGTSLVLAGFLVFASFRSLDWTGSMPDTYKLALAFVLPSALLLLLPESALYAGLLLGISLGVVFEQLKIRFFVRSRGRRALAGLIGTSGVLVLLWTASTFMQTVLSQFLISILLGLWITLFAPWLFTITGIFTQAGQRIEN